MPVPAVIEGELVYDNTNAVLNDLALAVIKDGRTVATANGTNLGGLLGAREPFALDEDLPIRATIFRLSATEALFLLTVHHIVADRPSLRLIAKELEEIYNARIEGRAVSLPELPVQYAVYAKGQQNLTEADFEQLWFYWRWQLRGQLAALKLPEDRPRPAIHTYTAARETLTLDATVVGRLGEDRFAATLAAFKVLMHRYACQDEIVVGTSEPCRTQPEVANLVGPFANLVVLRSDLGGNPSFSTAVQRVKKTVDQARAHQEMPFDKLVQLLNPEKDMSRTALFDVELWCGKRKVGRLEQDVPFPAAPAAS